MIVKGDLRDDHNPEFAQHFYRALSVVCDDLFFARYRRESNLTTTLSKDEGVSVATAADALLTALYGDTYNEEDKTRVVDDLLDVRLLPATNVEGVEFNAERIDARSVQA